MKRVDHNITASGHAQSVELEGVTRWVFIGGQIPELPDTELAADFAGQCRACWHNVAHQLAAAGMTFENIVKVTIFLTDPSQSRENREIRQELLSNVKPAMSVIVTRLLKASWLLEIEVVAAK